MNRLSIIFAFMFIFGLTASSVSAADALHAGSGANSPANYDNLSPAEFFYGVSIDNNNEGIAHPQAVEAGTQLPADNRDAYAGLSPSAFFYGYDIPARLETTDVRHGLRCNKAAAPVVSLSEVSDPAIFFGYMDVDTHKGFCANC
jgi:hypothetical protein